MRPMRAPCSGLSYMCGMNDLYDVHEPAVNHGSCSVPTVVKPLSTVARRAMAGTTLNREQSRVRPSGSDVRPSGSDVRPSGSDVRPSGSDVRPSGSDIRSRKADIFEMSALRDLTSDPERRTYSNVRPSGYDVRPSGSDGVHRVFPSARTIVAERGSRLRYYICRPGQRLRTCVLCGCLLTRRSFLGTMLTEDSGLTPLRIGRAHRHPSSLVSILSAPALVRASP